MTRGALEIRSSDTLPKSCLLTGGPPLYVSLPAGVHTARSLPPPCALALFRSWLCRFARRVCRVALRSLAPLAPFRARSTRFERSRSPLRAPCLALAARRRRACLPASWAARATTTSACRSTRTAAPRRRETQRQTQPSCATCLACRARCACRRPRPGRRVPRPQRLQQPWQLRSFRHAGRAPRPLGRLRRRLRLRPRCPPQSSCCCWTQAAPARACGLRSRAEPPSFSPRCAHSRRPEPRLASCFSTTSSAPFTPGPPMQRACRRDAPTDCSAGPARRSTRSLLRFGASSAFRESSCSSQARPARARA
jgi:hypothetical protein